MSDEILGKYTFKIARFNPEKDKKPSLKNYEVEVTKGTTVLDALNQIKWYQDGTLAFRRSCRSAICGSCAMLINGKNDLACHTQVEHLKTKTITIAPLPGFKIIKDLIVDFDKFFDNLKKVMPYLITYSEPPALERLQDEKDREKIDTMVNCILCGACTSSCPSYWYNDNYLGTAALFKAARFLLDTRDEGKYERINLLDDKNALWRCHTIFNCEEACPKNLAPNAGIVELKKEVLKAKI